MKEAELKSGQSSALEKLSDLGNRFRNLSEQVLSHKNDSNEASNDLGGRMAELNSTLETISGFVRDLMLMAETSNGSDAVIGTSTVIEAEFVVPAQEQSPEANFKSPGKTQVALGIGRIKR